MEKEGATRDGGSLLGARGQHRLLEHGDGRGPIYGPQVERVRFRLIVVSRMRRGGAPPRRFFPRCRPQR